MQLSSEMEAQDDQAMEEDWEDGEVEGATTIHPHLMTLVLHANHLSILPSLGQFPLQWGSGDQVSGQALWEEYWVAIWLAIEAIDRNKRRLRSRIFGETGKAPPIGAAGLGPVEALLQAQVLDPVDMRVLVSAVRQEDRPVDHGLRI